MDRDIRVLLQDFLCKLTKQLIQTIAVNVLCFVKCLNPLGFQCNHFSIVIRIPSGNECMAGPVPPEVNANLDGGDILFPEFPARRSL